MLSQDSPRARVEKPDKQQKSSDSDTSSASGDRGQHPMTAEGLHAGPRGLTWVPWPPPSPLPTWGPRQAPPVYIQFPPPSISLFFNLLCK